MTALEFTPRQQHDLRDLARTERLAPEAYLVRLVETERWKRNREKHLRWLEWQGGRQ